MKKNALFLVFLLLAVPAYAQNTMRLVYFENFPPFSWREDDQMQGILIDVVNEAIQVRMGIPVSHEGYPWARAQKMVRNGEADGFATVPTPERREYAVISHEPVVVAAFTPFVNRDNPKLEALKEVATISDLRPFSIGHYTGSGWAGNNLANMEVDYAPTLDVTLMKLARGRFDVFVDVSQVVRYRVMQLGLSDRIVELPNILDSDTFNLCIGKDSPFVVLLGQFDETMREMRDDGTLNEICSRYR